MIYINSVMKNSMKDVTAKRLLEVVPALTARIRAEIRSCIPDGFSFQHFRILRSIMHGRNFVGEIAQHQGVSQPSMSRSIDSLVKRGFVERGGRLGDRRKAPLRLTKKGRFIIDKIIKSTESRLGDKISRLDAGDRKMLEQGLFELEKFFSADYSGKNKKAGR
jgi:DNA-binding MarR family transcriptional regulator